MDGITDSMDMNLSKCWERERSLAPYREGFSSLVPPDFCIAHSDLSLLEGRREKGDGEWRNRGQKFKSKVGYGLGLAHWVQGYIPEAQSNHRGSPEYLLSLL